MSSQPQGPDSSGQPAHRPVLLRETIHYLNLKEGLTVVDGTVGGGGHSREILKRIGPRGRLIGLDRDPSMLKLAAKTLDSTNCSLHRASYAELADVLEDVGIESTDRILLDLGLSSDQLADENRGFSFDSTGPLDLRFDPDSGRPAWKLIEDLNVRQLEELLRRYGQEPNSRKIARHVAARQRQSPIRTTSELVETVEQAVPAGGPRQRHPATRVMQALRIAVNDELGHLETALRDGCYGCLSTAGRLVVISFHSLEDRLVKSAFRDKTRWRNLTPRPVTAGATERKVNPRSRSAKLRAAIKR